MALMPCSFFPRCPCYSQIRDQGLKGSVPPSGWELPATLQDLVLTTNDIEGELDGWQTLPPRLEQLMLCVLQGSIQAACRTPAQVACGLARPFRLRQCDGHYAKLLRKHKVERLDSFAPEAAHPSVPPSPPHLSGGKIISVVL